MSSATVIVQEAKNSNDNVNNLNIFFIKIPLLFYFLLIEIDPLTLSAFNV